MKIKIQISKQKIDLKIENLKIIQFHSIKTEKFDLAKYAAVNQDLTRTRSSSVKHSCLLERVCEIITPVEIHDCSSINLSERNKR